MTTIDEHSISGGDIPYMNKGIIASRGNTRAIGGPRGSHNPTGVTPINIVDRLNTLSLPYLDRQFIATVGWKPLPIGRPCHSIHPVGMALVSQCWLHRNSRRIFLYKPYAYHSIIPS